MENRYAGEIRINPMPILRNDDFNNAGEIGDIDDVLAEALAINNKIGDRINRLRAYLSANDLSGNRQFNFADGGYIAMKGFSDKELLELKSKGLIDLFDFATDKSWVKKYGAQFGLIWEDGRAVEI
jgi:hypothetical protein